MIARSKQKILKRKPTRYRRTKGAPLMGMRALPADASRKNVSTSSVHAIPKSRLVCLYQRVCSPCLRTARRRKNPTDVNPSPVIAIRTRKTMETRGREGELAIVERLLFLVLVKHSTP